MEKSIMIVLIGNRMESAVAVQKVLTETGCFIKTRLGLHDGLPGQCADTGLIILEILGDASAKKTLYEKLEAVPHVSARLVELSV